MYNDIAAIKQSGKITTNPVKAGNHYQIVVDTYHKAVNNEVNNKLQKVSQH